MEPDDSEANDDDVSVLASSTERAKAIVDNGQVSLNQKLVLFTVMGTQQSRVIRLFPCVSCSCPVTATCYHAIAAKTAVGLPVWDAGGRKVNLKQLGRNRRKRADKTSGWKCPRVRDVDVIPAADADDDVTTQLVTAVTGTHPPEPELQELLPAAAEPAVVGDANHDVCAICNQVDLHCVFTRTILFPVN